MKRFLFRLTLVLILPFAPVSAEEENGEAAADLAPWQQAFLNLPQEDRERYALLVRDARELFQQKRIFETIEKLRDAETIFDKSPDVQNLLGACQVEFRAFDKARAHFERAAELAPGNPSVMFNIAELAFVSREWQRAEELLSEVLEQLEGEEGQIQMNRLIEFKLLLTKLKLGKEEQAREMAGKYDLFDDTPYPYYALAAIHFHEDERRAAQAELARAERIFRNPAILAPWQDTMMEFGYVRSFFGGPQEASTGD